MKKTNAAKNRDSKSPLLNQAISSKFREIINSSPIFCEDEDIKQNWSLICAVMDRVDSCVKYINKREQDFINSEEDFMIFFMFAAMLKDAIRELFVQLKIEYPFDEDVPDSYKFFYKTFAAYECLHKMFLQKENNQVDEQACSRMDCLSPKCPKYNEDKMSYCPKDDQFFEFLRALVFAHPCKTNRPRFLNNETQYSPWVIANKITSLFYSEDMGIRIYSNKFDEIFDFNFKSDVLKDYIKSRYSLLKVATNWAKNKIKEFESRWSERKVNRALTPIGILEDIKEILTIRHESDLNYELDDAISYLSCPLTEEKNQKAVAEYRKHLINTIPELCDSIDRVNREEYLTDAFMNAISPQLKWQHNHCSYQLEKIFSYLKRGDKLQSICDLLAKENYYNSTGKDVFNNEEWGLLQLAIFYDSLAKDYVTIRLDMPFDEIRLLVTTACYLEQENQKLGKISPSLKKTMLA